MSTLTLDTPSLPSAERAIDNRSPTETISLQRIPGTSLYQPLLPGKGEKMLFLLWNNNTSPSSLDLNQSWADQGVPANPGFLLFFSNLPTAAQSPAVEKQLRELLPSPTTTAIAWITFTISTGAIALSTLLKTRLNAHGQPCVDGETPLKVFSGVKTVVFPDAALLQGSYTDASLNGLISTYAPSPINPPPGGIGIFLPLTGGPSGKLVGCVCFSGLIDALSSSKEPNRVLKSLMTVSIDPLNPIDSSRNFQVFTGLNYYLIADPAGYRLVPAK
jgi:hypothetical protein